jgi:hypothetical protein
VLKQLELTIHARSFLHYKEYGGGGTSTYGGREVAMNDLVHELLLYGGRTDLARFDNSVADARN